MSNPCGCSGNISPQPCCSDCPETNPCETGCLDFIDAGCIEYTSTLPTCISISNGSKLDFVIQAIDNELCTLKSSGDKFVRISSADTISGYLYDKLITCPELTTTIVTVGSQQKLKICIDYTELVNTIIADNTLMTLLCQAIANCA